MDDFVVVNGKKYRKGYTTGSCAAAASKAAVSMLISGGVLDYVVIDTPAGIRLTLPVSDITFLDGSAKCAVIKDGGDDPDVTSGLKIFAEAKFTEAVGVNLKTGEGIGMVTLTGLRVEVGKPAINPVPMKMIMKEVQEILPVEKGVEITLSVPGGEEVSKKTYNPKLGIIGGISILGTTGIVEPMSEEAWKESLALELKQVASRGCKTVVFIFGNYGDSFVKGKLNIANTSIVKISNFVGFMLDRAVEYGFEKILLAGHLGKLIKVAAGIFHTHSRVADARMEIMAAYASLEGATTEIVSKIYECTTTEAAAQIIDANGLKAVYQRIASNASKRCDEYTFGKIKTAIILFNANEEILASDMNANELLEELRGGHE